MCDWVPWSLKLYTSMLSDSSIATVDFAWNLPNWPNFECWTPQNPEACTAASYSKIFGFGGTLDVGGQGLVHILVLQGSSSRLFPGVSRRGWPSQNRLHLQGSRLLHGKVLTMEKNAPVKIRDTTCCTCSRIWNKAFETGNIGFCC